MLQLGRNSLEGSRTRKARDEDLVAAPPQNGLQDFKLWHGGHRIQDAAIAVGESSDAGSEGGSSAVRDGFERSSSSNAVDKVLPIVPDQTRLHDFSHSAATS